MGSGASNTNDDDDDDDEGDNGGGDDRYDAARAGTFSSTSGGYTATVSTNLHTWRGLVQALVKHTHTHINQKCRQLTLFFPCSFPLPAASTISGRVVLREHS